jgi:hypothetical protein
MAQLMPKEILGLLAGADTEVTFSSNATSIEITTDQPLYIATVQAKLAIQSTGLEGDRIFIAGQAYGERKLWTGKKVYVKSASTLDSTRIQIIGDPS